MSIIIEVPDDIEKAAKAEAVARGSSAEELILATLNDRFGLDTAAPGRAAGGDTYAPLLAMIGIGEGHADSSVRHDHRLGDPS